MNEFSDLHKAIIRYVKRVRVAMREDILREVPWEGDWTRKEVQEAFTFLKKHGYIYRVPDGWYQTDLDI